MSDFNSNSKRVAKNTLYLYLRSLLVMIASIYMSRVILEVLGVDDYGIYNVVGGFVTIFSVLSGTLVTSTQRFLAFELGKNVPNVKKVFSTAITVHVLLTVVVLIILESFGIWFVNYKMNIPVERLYAANWVFQCSVLTFCINLISIPYNAAIIAYEKMSAFAYISILEISLKLGSVFLLFFISYDSLIVYAVFMMMVAVILRLIYGWYCHKNFPECKYEYSYDKNTIKEMLSFSGWNFIGSTSLVANDQGINVLINLFFGVALNAARGIATQVDAAINTFVLNFMTALTPSITKNYASGNFGYVNNMIISGTKYSFYLFWPICLPVLINLDFVLELWLKEVPEYTVVFIKLAFIFRITQNLSRCLYITAIATGNIKKYQLTVGLLSIMPFPTAYFFYKFGMGPEGGYWAMIIFSIICFIARLFLLKDMFCLFSIFKFLEKVLVPIMLVLVPSLVVAIFIHSFFQKIDFCGFLFESCLYSLLCLTLIFYAGITKNERTRVREWITKRINSNLTALK